MPAPTNYTPSSTFWSSITNLVDTTLVTAELLYKLGINKVADRTEWLRDEIARQATRLQSSTPGSRATAAGSVDLSTLIYDPTAGSLNGKSFGVESNTNAATITFGTGGSAPTSPASVAAQINAATGSDPLATVDGANKLLLTAVTAGALSTIEVMNGSAVSLLGLTVGVGTSGVATGNDGASAVGVAAIAGTSFSIAAGTVRSALTSIANTAISAGTNASVMIWTGVQTFQNNLIMVGDSGRMIKRPAKTLTVSGLANVTADVWLVDNPAADGTVSIDQDTLVPVAGEEIVVVIANLATGRSWSIQRSGGAQLAVLLGASGANYGSIRCKFIGSVWRVIDASSRGGTLTLNGANA
jgi:hypothetical protein